MLVEQRHGLPGDDVGEHARAGGDGARLAAAVVAARARDDLGHHDADAERDDEAEEAEAVPLSAASATPSATAAPTDAAIAARGLRGLEAHERAARHARAVAALHADGRVHHAVGADGLATRRARDERLDRRVVGTARSRLLLDGGHDPSVDDVRPAGARPNGPTTRRKASATSGPRSATPRPPTGSASRSRARGRRAARARCRRRGRGWPRTTP